MDIAAMRDVLAGVVGASHVITDPDALAGLATDETHERQHTPDLAVRPATAEEVAQVVAACNTHGIPVVARGGGSGVSGGALATHGGVILLMERLNRIIEIDANNMTTTVETGVITGELQEQLIAAGLCLPPDPGSRSWCQVGGNLAEAAAGPKSVKYGAFRDYALNLEVVLASGEIIWTGANVRKIACGYNLTQLMLGSEGTLGIITKVVFRLIPAPTEELVVRLAFDSLAGARDMICGIFEQGLVPSEVELMEAGAIEATKVRCDEELPEGTQALLWVGFDGRDEDQVLADAEQLSEFAESLNALEALVAIEPEHRKNLWAYRHNVGEAIIQTTTFLDVDVSFPRSKLLEVVESAREIGEKYGFNIVAFGHSGDGNLHIQILRGDLDDATWNGPVREGIRELYARVVSLGGALSGEHGIGCTLTPYLDTMFGETHMALMRGIKNVFDPKGILNPGKVLTDKA